MGCLTVFIVAALGWGISCVGRLRAPPSLVPSISREGVDGHPFLRGAAQRYMGLLSSHPL